MRKGKLKRVPKTATKNCFQADKLATGITLLLALTVLQRLMGFLRNILFCRFMDPTDLGTWNLAFSVLILAAPLAVLGVPGSFGRYVEHYRQRVQLRSFLRSTSVATVAIAGCGIIIMLMTQSWLAWLVFGDSHYASLMRTICLALIGIITFNFLVELFTALRQVRVVTYMQFANSLLFAACALPLLTLTSLGANGVVIAYAAACVISSIGALRVLWHSLNTLPNETEPLSHRNLWGKLLPFATFVWASNLLNNLFTAVDRYMIVHFATSDADEAIALVGQYHSSRIIGELMVAVAALLASVVLPYLSHDWEKGRFRRVSYRLNLTLKLSGVMLVVGGILAMILAPWVYEWALGGKYSQGESVLPWTLAYCIWFGLVLIAQNYLWCIERALTATLICFFGLLVNIGLNCLLLPHFGLMGAVVATGLANLISLSMVLYKNQQMGMRLDGGVMSMILLPMAFPLGAFPAALSLLVTVFWGLYRGWLFTRREKRELEDIFSQILETIRRVPTTGPTPA